MQTNSALDGRYEKLEAADGRPYFNLKAANSQAIGTSQMYAATSGRDNCIASVKANGSTKTIKHVKDRSLSTRQTTKPAALKRGSRFFTLLSKGNQQGFCIKRVLFPTDKRASSDQIDCMGNSEIDP